MLRGSNGLVRRAFAHVQKHGASVNPSVLSMVAASAALLQPVAPLHTKPTCGLLRHTSLSATAPAVLLGRRGAFSMVGAPQGVSRRFYRSSRVLLSEKQPTGAEKRNDQLQGVHALDHHREEKEEEREEEREEETPQNRFSFLPAVFQSFNIVMLLIIANVTCYFAMMFGSDDFRDFVVEHFTLSHENFSRIYPIFTNALYQENLLQMVIDLWLLSSFGDSMLAFLGNGRLTFFMMLCTVAGGLIHVARQKVLLHYGMDELEMRGRCYGPNPFIMGCISLEGLVFRHLNISQQPPIPFLVLTAFIVVLDVWRIFTTRPEEHGAATGGALMAIVFWMLPTRMFGLDKLTAAV